MSRPKNAPPAICLNMILRNEAHIRNDGHVVQKTLDSVAPYISSWVIVDTGSNDETRYSIADYMARLGIPGGFYERPWRNFGHNRTEALILARRHGDYIWVMDAGDVLVGAPDFTRLSADAYALRNRQANRTGWRTQLFRDGLRWRYEGADGATLACDDPCVAVRMEGEYEIENYPLDMGSQDSQKDARDTETASGPILLDTTRRNQTGGAATVDEPFGEATRAETRATSQPRLILAGHSHLVAIAGAHVFSGPLGLIDGPRGDGTQVMGGPPDTTYWDTLAEVGTGADVGVIWGGNEHNAAFFFEAGPRFDFLSAHVPRMNPSAQILPKGAIRRRFQQSMKDLDAVLERLSTGELNRIALIGTPPPKGDNEALRAFALLEEFFVSAAASIGQSMETLPITDPFVRLKLWYVLQEMLAEVARTRGALFIPVPKEVQDDDGFLKREFWLSDVTHANEAYGMVMYETVLQAFR